MISITSGNGSGGAFEPRNHDRVAELAGGLAVETIHLRHRSVTYDLARWITELRPHLHPKEHALALDLGRDPLPPVLYDRELIGRVVVTLVTIANRFTGADSQVIVRARPCARGVHISVEGTDLWLADDAGNSATGAAAQIDMCRRIVERHGGTMIVDDDPDTGTSCAFELPAVSEHER